MAQRIYIKNWDTILIIEKPGYSGVLLVEHPKTPPLPRLISFFYMGEPGGEVGPNPYVFPNQEKNIPALFSKKIKNRGSKG